MNEKEIRADERKRLAKLFLKKKTMYRITGAMSQYPTEYTEEVPLWPNGEAISRAILRSRSR
jgi:hypothetical protein